MVRVKLPAPTFDLESWSSNYTGPILVLRLAQIALYCPSLSQHALSLAISAVKAGKDVSLYQYLVQLALTLGQEVDIDQEWIARQDDANKRELARLEGELRGYKNNLIRESIRMGQEDLATHLLQTGSPVPISSEEQTGQHGYAAAYTSFAKMRDFCTTPTHIAGMTLRLLFTGLVQTASATHLGTGSHNHWSSVNSQASRLSSTSVKAEEEARLRPIWTASRALAALGQGNYQEAASLFSQVDFALASNGAVHGFEFCKSAASANDLAIYGGLTALATMSREELDKKVLSGDFRAFLELEPHLRKAITLYTTGKYRACLDMLKTYYADWSLDIYLGAGIRSSQGSHVDRLLASIRERSITAYFGSFSQVSLASLAQTFPPQHESASSEQQLEDELMSMIQNGTLNARLDVVNKILLAPYQDRRSTTQANAIEAAEAVERTLLQRLFKVNVALSRLELPTSARSNKAMG